MIPISPTVIVGFFKNFKTWIGIGAILAILAAIWWGYATLKDNIRLEIENQIIAKAASFKQESGEIAGATINDNKEAIDGIRKEQRENISSLNSKLASLERKLKEGLITEAQRREQASIARYTSIIFAYCSKQPLADECRKQLEVAQ